ncbi:MAG TPA: alpha-glucosidase [Spirochaetota bacterium]|nr:alpha-glucosidase [Spirochaetota bacterium]
MGMDWLWWKHGVIYQIYPRSFYDSNGDGVGDIAGIIEKLAYLSDLGIDGIWLSPINTSPMFDFGYDISDYRGIDPVFGTQRDFDTFIEAAHRRGIRVILDLVMNHTSHLHPWFVESRSSRDNPKRDWYIWRDGRKGRYPNNWMAAFGGRAWEWDEKTQQYYLHSFLKEQPDVNWRNPELKKAMFAEIRFWLDRGVDGFRLDVVNQFVKDDRFRNNPFSLGPYPRPYDLQRHVFDRDRPELHDILKEFRSLLDSYDERMSVGEVNAGVPGDSALAAGYLGSGDELHLSFDFSFVFQSWSARGFLRRIAEWDALIPVNSWPCVVLNNHDQPRSRSRFGGGTDAPARAKLAAAMLLTLRGTPFLYYGEEIGMSNGNIPRKEIQDPVGKRYWPFHPGRDPERTPMQWSAEPNAGFSSGKPWLRVNGDYRGVNVELQSGDGGSVLEFYRKLIALRRSCPALNRGSWESAGDAKNDVLCYTRTHEREKMFVALNFSASPRRIRPALGGAWRVALSTHKSVAIEYPTLDMGLAPYEATVLERVS